mmetsp:Transcript_8860/g.18080  ORF Transcript_8860/g.18080 Transcript_8860/m.18080 type:complete len:147 (-) Transcript_8860:87-527(-)
MSSADGLRDWLESQTSGSQLQNVNLALAQGLAQNGGGFPASAPPSQSHINALAVAGLLGQNPSSLSGLSSPPVGMQVPGEGGLQASLNAALMSQLANSNTSAQQHGGSNGSQQQNFVQRTSTPPADALSLLARLSGANNGNDSRQM